MLKNAEMCVKNSKKNILKKILMLKKIQKIGHF